MMRYLAPLLALIPGVLFAAPSIPSHCVALTEAKPGIHLAALETPGLAETEVRIHYVGHSTFVITTAAGLRIATDFTGFVGVDVVPDVVTMNKAHSSHYTLSPDPRIPHVLKGWGDTPEQPADHYLELADVIIRNVTTDIRSFGGREPDGNSIFIFEVAGLCIGHLGHLHHEPSPAQYARIGRLDVVMAPVDGGYTMSQAEMIRVLKRVKSRLVLPMHWFGPANLESFLAGMADEFVIERAAPGGFVLSLATLPRKPTIRVVQPRALGFED